MLEIALASLSPRRRELLTSAGFEFRLFPVKVSEIINENLNPAEVAAGLAQLKGRAAIEEHKLLKEPGFLVLSADTIVVLGQRVFGKPSGFSQAQQYLRSLSGKTHRVITGLFLLESGTTKVWSGAEMTEVQFRPLSEREIADYVASGEPMDKAGAYAIQGEGHKFVSSLSGSKSNVIGLPLERLERALSENGWNVRRHAPDTSKA
jgi:septum formation protein